MTEQQTLEQVLTTWYADEARGTHLDFDDLPSLVKRIEAHYASVQPPTREQIAEARNAAWRKHITGQVPHHSLGPSAQDFIAGWEAAVLALFPQPTPSVGVTDTDALRETAAAIDRIAHGQTEEGDLMRSAADELDGHRNAGFTLVTPPPAMREKAT
jgi:hypothetical protein